MVAGSKPSKMVDYLYQEAVRDNVDSFQDVNRYGDCSGREFRSFSLETTLLGKRVGYLSVGSHARRKRVLNDSSWKERYATPESPQLSRAVG